MPCQRAQLQAHSIGFLATTLFPWFQSYHSHLQQMEYIARGKYTAIFLVNHRGKVLEELTAGEEFYENWCLAEMSDAGEILILK